MSEVMTFEEFVAVRGGTAKGETRRWLESLPAGTPARVPESVVGNGKAARERLTGAAQRMGISLVTRTIDDELWVAIEPRA